MSTQVEALVCAGPGQPYEPRTVLLGDVREDEALIRMCATGICHTDYACANGAIPVPYPFIGGHEGAGVVEQIGSKVDHLAPGDHVLLTFSSCGTCVHCFQRIPAYCTQMRDLNFKGSRVDGTTGFTLVDDGRPAASHFFGQSSFAAKSIVSASSAVRIDKKLPLDIVCTFGCGIQTGAGTVLNVLKPRLGSTIAVFGAGAVGMAAIMAAKLTPAAKIIAVDVVESKLDSALQLGATDAINSLKVSVVDEIKKQTGGRGVDLALDATGRVEVIRDMFESAAPGSLVVTVGAPPMGQHIHIEPARWLEKGVSYMGAHQGSSVPQQFIPLLLQFWQSGRFPVERLIKTYSHREIGSAHHDLTVGTCIKAVLKWP